MRSIIFYLFISVGTMLIFYLSWLPQPQLSLVWFVPKWLSYWADANENNTIRTSVPFVILGIVVGSWLLSEDYLWWKWLTSGLGLFAIVIIAEAGQIFLVNRSFDMYDITWGILGSVVGMSMAILSKELKTLLSN